MSQLILEFPLEPGATIVTSTGELFVDLGNGVSLKSTVPRWVEGVNRSVLQLIMEVDGSPPSDKLISAPVE